MQETPIIWNSDSEEEGRRVDRSKLHARIVASDYAKLVQAEETRPDIGEYHIGDFWLFGHTVDLMHCFDIRPMSLLAGGLDIRRDKFPETNLAETSVSQRQSPVPNSQRATS